MIPLAKPDITRLFEEACIKYKHQGRSILSAKDFDKQPQMFFNKTESLYEWQRAHLSYHASNYVTDEPLKIKIAMESIKETALNKIHAEIVEQGPYSDF